MRMTKLLAGALLVLTTFGAAHADPKSGKPNGDSSSDLAPLDQSGHAAEEGPMAHANTPPIGGATQGGGGNPTELGPIDTQKDASKNKK